MINKSVILSIIFITTLSCSTLRTDYLTEQILKTIVEKHNVGEFSSLKAYTIYKSDGKYNNSYLEFTGYKYNGDKGIIIATGLFSTVKTKVETSLSLNKESYIFLSVEECLSIINNYKVLQIKISKEKPKLNEEIYHDYTVSKDMFISYKIDRLTSSILYIDVWVNGIKYIIPTNTLIKSLKNFINY